MNQEEFLNSEKKNPEISVVIPVYLAKDCLEELYNRLIKELSGLVGDFEIILVNDGSPDDSWQVINELAKKDGRVKGVNLSRNFGQQRAITAGLDFVEGDWIVVMDDDLQDRPEEIKNLFNKAREGFDVVFANRCGRKDDIFKIWYSKFFYWTFDRLTNNKTNKSVSNFGIYSKKVMDNFKKMKEQARSLPIFINWLGFNRTHLDVEHGERFSGKTSYNFFKMLNFAVETIVAESNRPLKFSIKIGLIIAFLSFVFAIIFVFRFFVLKIPVQGWTSIMVSLFFFSGLILANLGLLGIYLGKIFDEIKGRPLYIVKDLLNIKYK
jgi:polyisoprenyl-phosphate glycosyltransferase